MSVPEFMIYEHLGLQFAIMSISKLPGTFYISQDLKNSLGFGSSALIMHRSKSDPIIKISNSLKDFL